MKIPKSVEYQIIKCARQNTMARNTKKELEEWLVKHGVDLDDASFTDMFADCLQVGYSPDKFIEYLKDL